MGRDLARRFLQRQNKWNLKGEVAGREWTEYLIGTRRRMPRLKEVGINSLNFTTCEDFCFCLYENLYFILKIRHRGGVYRTKPAL